MIKCFVICLQEKDLSNTYTKIKLLCDFKFNPDLDNNNNNKQEAYDQFMYIQTGSIPNSHENGKKG